MSVCTKPMHSNINNINTIKKSVPESTGPTNKILEGLGIDVTANRLTKLFPGKQGQSESESERVRVDRVMFIDEIYRKWIALKMVKKENVMDIHDVIEGALCREYGFDDFLNDFQFVLQQKGDEQKEEKEEKEEAVCSASRCFILERYERDKGDEREKRESDAVFFWSGTRSVTAQQCLDTVHIFIHHRRRRRRSVRRSDKAKFSKFVATKTYNTSNRDDDASDALEADQCFVGQMLSELELHGVTEETLDAIKLKVVEQHQFETDCFVEEQEVGAAVIEHIISSSISMPNGLGLDPMPIIKEQVTLVILTFLVYFCVDSILIVCLMMICHSVMFWSFFRFQFGRQKCIKFKEIFSKKRCTVSARGAYSQLKKKGYCLQYRWG